MEEKKVNKRKSTKPKSYIKPFPQPYLRDENEAHQVVKQNLITEAYHIWNAKLQLGKFFFNHKNSLTEKETSKKTWSQCDDQSFEIKKDFYKSWNNEVIALWNFLQPDKPLARETNPVKTPEGEVKWITKICKGDRAKQIKTVETREKIAITHTYKSALISKLFKTGQNPIKAVTQGIIQKIKNDDSLIMTQKNQLTYEAMLGMEDALEEALQKKMEEDVTEMDTLMKLSETKSASEMFKEFCDFQIKLIGELPNIAKKDDEGNDEYSEEARKKRKGEGKW